MLVAVLFPRPFVDRERAAVRPPRKPVESHAIFVVVKPGEKFGLFAGAGKKAGSRTGTKISHSTAPVDMWSASSVCPLKMPFIRLNMSESIACRAYRVQRTDGRGEGVGSMVGLGYLRHAQQHLDHLLHLILISPCRAGHRFFYGIGRMLHELYLRLLECEPYDSTGLRDGKGG